MSVYIACSKCAVNIVFSSFEISLHLSCGCSSVVRKVLLYEMFTYEDVEVGMICSVKKQNILKQNVVTSLERNVNKYSRTYSWHLAYFKVDLAKSVVYY